MSRKHIVCSVGTGLAGAAVIAALSLLVGCWRRRSSTPDQTMVDGVTTIEDAVDACRNTGLRSWNLVAYAQQLAARKVTYSRRNTWDTPACAFERGRGYCQQQALALMRIYTQLGIQARPVFATRCAFPPKMVDGMPWPGGVSGHVWLRVTLEGDERDVCPGSLDNMPGVTHFRVLSKVHTLYRWLRPWLHLASSLENMRRDRVAWRLASATSPAVFRLQCEDTTDPRGHVPRLNTGTSHYELR